ncbi:hypothetical protein Tco_0625108 [Tanacetum coccineum]|uniref:Transposase (Putative), gypsy type n=1 Tax=Tanacetum coccineum TaxID=301880 RepID=A0ABQ4WFV3_9ASTR
MWRQAGDARTSGSLLYDLPLPRSLLSLSFFTDSWNMVDSFCEAFYIPAGVHPTAPGRDKTIIQFLVYMGLLDFIQTADPRKVQAVEVWKGADQEDVASEDAYLNLADPDEDAIAVRQGEERVVSEQPKKVKRRRFVKQCDALPAKKLRTNHPSLASCTDGKTLANLEQIMPESSLLLAREQPVAPSVVPLSQESEGFVDLSAQGSFQILATAESSGLLNHEESESSDDSFYEIPNVDPTMAKRWATRQICLGSEVRSRTKHELELKEKLIAKYAARVSSLSGEKSALTEEVSALKVTIAQKDHDISLLDSHATSLASGLENAKVACTEAGDKIISLTSERDMIISEVCPYLLFYFKKKMEVQQEEQAQELYNRVAELEAHVMDVSGHLEGEFYPTYLTTLAGRRWLLAHRVQLALLKCLKSSEYQGILGHALGRAIDFGMQAGLEAGHEHGSAERSLSVVDAYNPKAAKANYIDSVKALEDVDFPLANLLKSKKDAGMDEVLDCFLLDEPAADLPEAVHLQPCLEQLTVPIHHAGDKTIVGETSLSFALINVHNRVEGAKKHAAALRKLMIDIVSDPLSSQTWMGEASTSVAPLSVEDYQEEDTDKALGSVVAVPQLKAPYL